MKNYNQRKFFETDSLFLASEKLRTHFGYHRLSNPTQKKFYFKEKIVHFELFSLFEFTFSGALTVEHYSLSDAYVFHFPIKGSFLVNSGEGVIKVGSEQLFVLSPNDKPHFKITEGVECLVIYIERKKLLNFARYALKHQPAIDLFFPLTHYSEEVVVSIRDAVLNLLTNDKLITERSIRQIYFKQAQPYLMTLLLTVLDNSYSSLMKLPNPLSLPLLVEGARRFMLENIEETINLDDLCRVSKVSKRVLNYQFKKHCGVTPMSYLLALRLDRLRQEIIQSQSTKNISEIAIKLGLTHPGRMAKNFKERFGVLPSQILHNKQ